MTSTTARWLRVKTIFNDVADLPPEQRPHALAELCGGDATLMRDVESLLRADERASAFIAQPAVLHAAKMPDSIGPFRIIREIGRGGMGVVWLGEREGEFAQRVAVKVISSGLAHADHVLRRFRAEREILARLEHPNIARLLDGGTTPDGLPYFVMEYVEGVPIDSYCREHELSVRQRLELFLGVAAAVQFAHQNLVIHRDLKPANILITANGVPKLLDFGIAKVLDDSSSSERTATELRAMTPDYASPEQILGLPLATTTDVYSLGVVLFELLTGEKVHRFTSRSPGEIAKVVLETDPQKPSTVASRSDASRARALRGDLDNIVQMALRKEPGRRYPSVQALADDVRRHLDGLPVTARPDTIRYRASKFVQRNRFAVAASVLVVLALLGGIATTSWQAVAARRSQDRAERRFAQLRKLARSLIFDLDEAIAPLSGATTARAKLVKTALEYLDSLAAEADDPELRLELANGYKRIAEIQGNSYYSNLGQTTASQASYAKAQRILEALATQKPNDRAVLQSLARTYMGMGDVEFSGTDLQKCESYYRKSVGVWNRVIAQGPLDLAESRTYALLLSRLGDVLGNPGYPNLGRRDEALKVYRDSLALREALLAKNPDNDFVARDVAEGLSKISYLANGSGNYALAIEMNDRAIALMRRVAARNPDSADAHHDLSFAMMNAAFPLRELGRFDEAARTLEESRVVMEKLAARDAASVLYRRSLSVINNHLSAILVNAGRPAEALEASTRAINLAEHLWASDEENQAAALDWVIAVRRGAEALIELRRFDAVRDRAPRAISVAADLAREGNERARLEQALLEARLGFAIAQSASRADGARHLETARESLTAIVNGSGDDVRNRNELALAHYYLARSQTGPESCASYARAATIWGEIDAAKKLPVYSRQLLETATSACR